MDHIIRSVKNFKSRALATLETERTYSTPVWTEPTRSRLVASTQKVSFDREEPSIESLSFVP